ncbi:hypothetical protein WR25_16886 [Diploscapter pachys]|uniref:Anaphase-promoting complex subunit 4 WD40 domain-containing protein n=1 Tax=Diploscapter pachys TaxID=2018661 RepID=A0A2A2LDQ9_9BILA|nr:hypothetical protein WR25_16886 [Diploscapter pachys]
MATALGRRELGSWQARHELGQYLDEDALIDRIGLAATLEGHQGCVNTLKWNSDGTLLASGSDDRTIIIWLMDEGGQCRLQTDHAANIFAVDFLPSSSDNIVLSAAGDHFVKLHEVTDPDATYTWTTDGRVKRLCTAPDEPYLFWSASEDGFIREYDTRTYAEKKLIKAMRWRELETNTRSGSNDARGAQVKTMAICQGRTELVAVGANHSIVSIYDRRGSTDIPVAKLANKDYICRPYQAHATHVAFDYYGTECIVNQGNGAIYIYKLKEDESTPTTLQGLDEILQKEEPVPVMEYTSVPRTPNRTEARTFVEQRKYSEAIECYSRCLPHITDPMERSLYYSNRGLCYMLRRWEGDTYGCIRDCVQALRLYPGNAKAMWRIGRCMTMLEQWDWANRIVASFRKQFPEDSSVEKIQKHISSDDSKSNGSNGSTAANIPVLKDQEGIFDYYQRFLGHRNYQTDIKEANFFGSKNQYIVAGSDCGSMILWDRATGVIRGVWKADENIVNIVQPHPTQVMLATSGIDDEIRLWEPLGQDVEDERRVTNIWDRLHTEDVRGARVGLQAVVRFLEENADEVRPECVVM